MENETGFHNSLKVIGLWALCPRAQGWRAICKGVLAWGGNISRPTVAPAGATIDFTTSSGEPRGVANSRTGGPTNATPNDR